MKTIFIFSTIVSLLASSALAGQFFENAVRRDPLKAEGKGILHLDFAGQAGHQYCTAFFVKNKDNKPYIMTARHCAHYEMTKACNAQRISFESHVGNFKGTCATTVFETQDLDETLLLGDFKDWDKMLPQIEFYELSEQRPRFDTPLVMLGYPSDPERNSQLTVTNKCWVSANRMVGPQDYPAVDQTKTQTFIKANPVADIASLVRHRYVAFNNCSVYGGNSGGPILKEGTNIVLGLPTTYYPDAKTIQPRTLTTSMDATADFVVKHRAALETIGIEFAQPYADGAYRPPFEMRMNSNFVSACYRTTDSGALGTSVDISWCKLDDD